MVMARTSRPLLAMLAGMTLLLLRPAIAVAQTPSPLMYWQYSAGEALAPLGGELPEWRVSVGANATLMPEYDGSQRYQPTGGPFADIQYEGRYFASSGEGIGVNVVRGKTYRAGVALSYDLGRDADIDHRLSGLGDVYPAPEAKLFVEYGILPFVLVADIRRGLGGHGGTIGDLGFYMPVVGQEHLFVFVGPMVTLADERHTRSYFGVNAQQASHSRFPRFDPSGGVRSTGLGISGTWFVTDHWFLEGDAAYERLLGDAASSPITEDSNQLAVSLSIGYRF
jgi:outer membrane scaffolding protein for murein synthesis (MipA/OmpV family)